ncbi:MAG: hypothetical protein A2Z95_03485 [Gallionellales bacterium GWA2_60_18]|nr:MAG: hypothetical protein A2Z95_03485 [Gallionellales bacterium GWA2_60_18]
MALGMIALFLAPPVAAADSPVRENAKSADEKPADPESVQPKFIWGILIKFAASKAFDIFFQWAAEKMFQGMSFSSMLPRAAAVSAPGAASLAPARKGGVTPIIPNVTEKAPTAPLSVENGKENYQGVMLALLVLQPDGETLAVRPLSAGFKSGEKFRIRLGSTFEGELSLDNIDPQGKRSRLYPADAGQIVKIKSGVPVILPLEKDSFFQFDQDAGEEKLLVTLRDSRAQGDAVARTMVHRQENDQGTGLLQEVVAGKFAAIAESIALKHRQ